MAGKLTLQQLESFLWETADILRGNMDVYWGTVMRQGVALFMPPFYTPCRLRCQGPSVRP